MPEQEPRPGRFEHVITDRGHHVRLTGANGEPVMVSEVYTEAAAVLDALRLVRRTAGSFTAHEPIVIDERHTARPHHVSVLDGEHHCTVCGYTGTTPPPIPCPGPPVAPGYVGERGPELRTPRIDRGPGHDAEDPR